MISSAPAHDAPLTGRVVRVMVFPDRPDCVLFYVPDGIALHVPKLVAPFSKVTVAEALAQGGVDHRITESVPGRWTASVQVMKKAERAERAQRQKLREASLAVLERGGGELARTRAEAIERKHAVDEQIRDIKNWLGLVKGKAATRGIYESPERYRRKERELAQLKEESQALQTRLGELRDQEKKENTAANNEELERFKAAAKRVLDEETFEAILDEMALDEEDEATELHGTLPSDGNAQSKEGK